MSILGWVAIVTAGAVMLTVIGTEIRRIWRRR